MAKNRKPKINVWEVVHWECPYCANDNDGQSWLMPGDEVTCSHCRQKCIVENHYTDCRPEKFRNKKAVT